MKVLIEYVKNMENVEDGNIYFHLAIPEHFEPAPKPIKNKKKRNREVVAMVNKKKTLKKRKAKKKKPSSSASKIAKINKQSSLPIPIYSPLNSYENSIINRALKILYDRKNKIGRIKRKCHSDDRISEECEKYVIEIIKHNVKTFKNWNSYRDGSHMRKYRKDNPICELCNIKRSKHTHHIIHSSDGGKECYDNYEALCIECHIFRHPELNDGLKMQWYKKSKWK